MPEDVDISERETLLARQLPEMTLSDASAPGSLTKPPEPVTVIKPEQRAAHRFEVEGVAVVTGGGGTLGLESARALLEHGASAVSLWDNDLGRAEEGAKSLALSFRNARISAYQVDVTDAESVKKAVKDTVDVHGHIDILCCFAGIVGCKSAVDMGPEEWKRVLDINTTGSFLCAQAVASRMIKQKSKGAIVFIASISGHIVNFPQPQVSYNVSKAALLHLTRSLAAEWAVHGIRVNSISPGYMDTILNEGDGLEHARKIWNERNPMGRMGQPSELTGPLVLLCSRAGSYINGADILVDGGATVF